MGSLLFKSESKWTPSQQQRADILFKYYPDLKKAYNLCRELGAIYEKTKIKQVAFTKLAQWYNKVEQADFKAFNIIAKTIELHYQSILNYFDNRSTNASAESFNAKIKAFRSQFRGVKIFLSSFIDYLIFMLEIVNPQKYCLTRVDPIQA